MDDILKSLADAVQQEGQKIEEALAGNEGKETPSESPAEKETKEEKSPSQEGEEAKTEEPKAQNTPDETNIPFHKHPDWIARERKLDERLNEVKREYESKLQDLETRIAPKLEAQDPSIPSWFSGLYGDDKEKWNDYLQYEASRRQEIKQEILREQEEVRTKEQKETLYWQEQTDKAITSLEQKHDLDLHSVDDNGQNSVRNAILKIAVEYQPSDENGLISLDKAYQIYKLQEESRKESKQARKEIASISNVDTKPESKPRGYKTPEDLKGGWYGISGR